MYDEEEYESDWGETVANSPSGHGDSYRDQLKFLYNLPKAVAIVGKNRFENGLEEVNEILSPERDKEDQI